MQNEQWKDIPGYEGLYQVSNLGRVKSYYNNREKLLGEYHNQNGYRKVGLSMNGKRKWVLVQTLVATSFLPNPNNLPEIDHINEIRNDNRAENLRWCTRLFNAYRTRKPVVQVNEDGTTKIWGSVTDAANAGYIHSQVSRCCNKTGKVKKHRGSQWFWLSEYNAYEQ
jgi:hypothetical protein